MEKEFIPYEQALALKELGFDEPCFGYYNMVNYSGKFQFDTRIWENSDDYIEAPLYQQSFRWFREKYGYDISIRRNSKTKYEFVIESKDNESNYYFIDFPFLSHEEAELECLKKLIEIVKEK